MTGDLRIQYGNPPLTWLWKLYPPPVIEEQDLLKTRLMGDTEFEEACTSLLIEEPDLLETLAFFSRIAVKR